MQRFRSNSSSSTLDSPLSPTYLSHISPSQFTATNTNNDKSSTANINIVPNSTRRGGPIHISAPSLTSPPSSLSRSAYDPPPTPTSPRLPQSPISSAAGVMKKLLRRRRDHTGDETGLGIVGASSGANNRSTGYEAAIRSPGGPGSIHSFVIVGGEGAVAPGTTVYDLEPPSPISPSTASTTHMISSPSSSSSSTSYSSTTRPSSGSMGPLVGTTGMISPRSPTFPQSMMTRFSAGRDHQQQHMHMQQQQQQQYQQQLQQALPAAHVTPSSTSTSPISIPVRSRSRHPSIPNATTATAPDTSPPVSVISSPGQVQSLSLSAAHLHGHHDRRSLSTGNLWSDKHQTPSSIQTTGSNRSAAAIAPDMPIQVPFSVDQEQQQPTVSSKSLSPLSSDQHGHIQGDVEFFKKSVEFLRAHHSRHNTADDWANRNKRKPQVPVRRQSESCLLDRIVDSHISDRDSSSNTNNRKTVNLSSSAPTNEEGEDNEAEEPRAFGPGSCWKDLDPTYPSMMEFSQLVDDSNRSLLSSVDILLMPTISSPTRYYDCPLSRKLVCTYLTSKGREFDEMIEFGFPLTSIVDDNKSLSPSSSKDCRFLTLRLTLTPWHARADEAKLYGSDDAAVVAAAAMPIKDMVNKFLSRTSAKLSCSPPRILSLLPDRKLSLTPDSSLAHQQQNSSLDGGAASPSSATFPSISQTPRSFFDMPTGTATTTLQPSSSQLPPSGPRSAKITNSGAVSPTATGGALPLCRDKSLCIMGPSIMSAPIPLSLSTASPSSLLRTVNSADYLSIDPSSPVIMSSPPSTPSPTTAYSNQTQHPYSQQRLLPPRKGSLSAMSSYYSQQQTLYSTGSFDDLTSQLSLPPAVPARRKASSPAIFNTTPTATAVGVYPGNNNNSSSSNNNITHSTRYQHLAPTPPPEMTNPSPRSRPTSPLVNTTNNNNRSNKFSTSPPSPQPMPGHTATTTTANPIPIPGASSRYPHHRPPIYGTSTPSPPAVNTAPSTIWSETDVYGAPSARIARPRRHDSSEQLHSHSHPHSLQQQQQATSSPPSSASAGATDAYRMYISQTQYAPPVNSH